VTSTMFFLKCLVPTYNFGGQYLPWKEQCWYCNCFLQYLVHLSSNNHLPQLVFNTQNHHLHQNSNPRHIFHGCGICSCNLLAKTILVLAPFFYRA
jgi:hypothetical protein